MLIFHVCVFSQVMAFFFFIPSTVYKKYGSSCLASTTFWDAQPTYWLADADAVKAVTSDRFTFMKDVEAVRTILIHQNLDN